MSQGFETPLIGLGLLILVVVCVELGYRFAQTRRGKEDDAAFSIVEGAAFSIVALLLGFSFSLAVSHYDERRLLVVKEANAIGTTALRSELLPQAEARQMRATLLDYVGTRLAFALADRDRDAQARASARSDRLQERMWSVAHAQSQLDPRSMVTLLFISSLNTTIDTSGEEAGTLNANIPNVVVAILAVVVLAGAFLLGYGFGRSGRHLVATIVFAFMLALVVAVILDLDHAQSGLIRVSLVPLRELQASLAAPTP